MTDCIHDARDLTISNPVDGYNDIELEGTCPKCGKTLYAYTELEVRE